MVNRKAHWDAIYAARPDRELSWFQSDPQPSLKLILEASSGQGRLIDVGGGSSILVDRLLDYPFDRIAVLDISDAALARSKARLGAARAARVEWIAADLTADITNLGAFDVWHDRAVFHFLTDPADRANYL